MEARIYYVGEKANKMYPELPVGTALKPVKKGDIYRVLSQGQSFFTPVYGEGDYGFTFFDVESTDPLSREMRGPLEHTGEVRICYDKLPGSETIRTTTYKITGTVLANTTIVVDPVLLVDKAALATMLESVIAKLPMVLDEDANYTRAPGDLNVVWEKEPC